MSDATERGTLVHRHIQESLEEEQRTRELRGWWEVWNAKHNHDLRDVIKTKEIK